MRFLSLFIAFTSFIITGSAVAAPITKEMANQYYNDCVSKQAAQNFPEEEHKFFCACTASKMMDNMTTEDIAAMTVPDETGRAATNYMIVKVYAPCMEYPAKAHYYNTCINNKTPAMGNNPEKTCNCMAGKVAKHIGNNGEKIFTDILARNPNIADPMSALESDKEFQNYVGQQLLGCVF